MPKWPNRSPTPRIGPESVANRGRIGAESVPNRLFKTGFFVHVKTKLAFLFLFLEHLVLGKESKNRIEGFSHNSSCTYTCTYTQKVLPLIPNIFSHSGEDRLRKKVGITLLVLGFYVPVRFFFSVCHPCVEGSHCRWSWLSSSLLSPHMEAFSLILCHDLLVD